MGIYFRKDGSANIKMLTLQSISLAMLLINTHYYSIKRINNDSMAPYLQTNQFKYFFLPKSIFNDIVLYKHLYYPKTKTQNLKFEIIAIKDP